MIDLDFSFEKSPWEAFLENKNTGETVSAVRLLSFLESENDETVDDVFKYIDDHALTLDISQLPKQAGAGASAVRLRHEEQLVQSGLDPKDLEENDPLRLYLEELMDEEILSDESAVIKASTEGNQKAMLLLTNAGIHRVIELAKEYVGNGVLLLDLIQEGSLGLWQGICAFRGGDYPIWRDRWIRNAMAKAIAIQARSNGVCQKMREAMEDYRTVDERLLSDLGRNATVEEIAMELHLSVEETETVKKMMEDARLIQRADKENTEADEPTPEDEQAVEDTAYFQARERIMELLSALSEEDAKLLTLRFGLENGRPLSPEETGERLGLTAQEVVTREANALAMLRNQ